MFDFFNKKKVEKLEEEKTQLELRINSLVNGYNVDVLTPNEAGVIIVNSVKIEKVTKLVNEIQMGIRRQASKGRNWSILPSVENEKILDAAKEIFRSKGYDVDSESVNWKIK
jgi:threonine synthase